jgi:site-specific recombinase XerD
VAAPPRGQADIEWSEIAEAAPQMADTMRRYLRQAATFLAPASVDVADNSLRIFARWLLTNTPVVSVGGVTRDVIEDFKVYLAGRPGMRGGSLSENTQRQRLRTLRVFFERIIEWDWADTPPRNPILNWDLPKRPEPLPKFLDDADAAKLMAAARASPRPTRPADRGTARPHRHA